MSVDAERIGYLIPEFPGQTHIFMWREIAHMRKAGVSLKIFSTRPPTGLERAKHAFADEAEAESIYLWPRRKSEYLAAICWAGLRNPLGFLQCMRLGFSLPVDARPRWRHVLPLVVPACLLAREATRMRVARLHSQSCANSAVICMMVRRLIGIPYSLVINANVAWWGGAMKEKFGEADFTMTHTQWLYDEVRRDFPELRTEQVLRGSIGVDTEAWLPPVPRIRRAETQTLLTVGRLHESKGHDYLIKALERLRADGRPVVLRVAGTGPELSKLQAQVTHAQLNDAVTFLGNLSEEDVKNEMRRADVFILASHAEPLGVVYMEAMAMEVPTIGTDAGGVAEIITNGVDGLLVPPRDVDALAKTIAKVLDDRDFSEALGKAGREKIVRTFDSRIGAGILYRRLYGRALSEKSSHGD